MKRRDFVATAAGALASATLAAPALVSGQSIPPGRAKLKGRLKQAGTRFAFAAGTSFEDMCRAAADLGLHGLEVTGPNDWPTLKKYGLTSTNCGLPVLTQEDGMVRKELHNTIEPAMRAAIDQVSAAGYPNLAVVGGQRKGLTYEEGARNLVAFLNRVKGHAEDKNVTLCLETVNSRYADPNFGRKDAICDHLEFTVDVLERVNSPRVKLAFDIYHVQIMDGDICSHLRKYMPWIAAIHTAGVPGRGPIDEAQELNYRFIAQTLVELGFDGYVAHEFRARPGGDALKDLARAIEIMDV